MSTIRRSNGKQEYVEQVLNQLATVVNHAALEIHVIVVDTEPSDTGEWSTYLAQKHTHPQFHFMSGHGADMGDPCLLHRFYGDSLDRTIWRSQRVLDMIETIGILSHFQLDYVFVTEDDVGFQGNLGNSLWKCIQMWKPNTFCHWDFRLRELDAVKMMKKTRRLEITYPQADLQGLFGVLLPTSEWLSFAQFAKKHFDKAPADWLLGRYLFRNQWKRIQMPWEVVLYHLPGKNSGKSSLRLYHSNQSWEKCENKADHHHVFKWNMEVRLVWAEGLFVEIPFFDSQTPSLGQVPEAAKLDMGAQLMKCYNTTHCPSMNRKGEIKELGQITARYQRKNALFIRIQNDTNLSYILNTVRVCAAKAPKTLTKA